MSMFCDEYSGTYNNINSPVLVLCLIHNFLVWTNEAIIQHCFIDF